MHENTGSQRDAASTIFNLPNYQVIDVIDLPDGDRRVVVASTFPPGCPSCGVLATKVHSRRDQQIRDVPIAGAIEVVWAKRRWFCLEPTCTRGTFWESTEQVPRYARSTTRLREQVVSAVITSGRAASEVARAHGVSWWLVQAAGGACQMVCVSRTERNGKNHDHDGREEAGRAIGPGLGRGAEGLWAA